MAAENSASRSPRASPGPSSPEAQDPSRAQITHSLGAKDPSWFRQTSEREADSPANRRSRGDAFASDAGSVSGRRQLPGMTARDATSAENQRDGNSSAEGGHSGSPSRSSSVRGSARWSNHFSTNTSLSGFSGTEHRSPTHSLDRFRIPPPQSENTSSFDEDDSFNSGKSMAMSPSQERISAVQTERSTSPTKGMGGFVQSAMLKRNDSVNKRWSAQTYTGLSRQNSFIGSNNMNRSDDNASTLSKSNSREQESTSLERKGSPSRATSKMDDFPKAADPRDDVFVKPFLPLHSRSRSVVSTTSSAAEKDEVGSTSRSTSPSKRWSPTKASWLENALKKPTDSPKPKAPPSQQPSWMAEINKTKFQRNSVDMGNAASPAFQKGALADLKFQSRSSPAFSPNIAENQEVEKMDVGIQELGNPKRESKKIDPKSPDRERPEDEPSTKLDHKSSPLEKEDYRQLISLPQLEKSSHKPPTINESRPSPNLHLNRTITPPITLKPEVAPLLKCIEPDTTPKNDFRSVLKSRQAPTTSSQPEKKEFINVIGTLKRTQTKNYVAPDELKNNILRGKAALNVTGGPKKSERRDEFKESILKQKEAMKAKAEAEQLAKQDGESGKGSKAPKADVIPEALAKRNALGKGIASAGIGIGTGASSISAAGQSEKKFESGKEDVSKRLDLAERRDVSAKPDDVTPTSEKKAEPRLSEAVTGEHPISHERSLPSKSALLIDEKHSGISQSLSVSQEPKAALTSGTGDCTIGKKPSATSAKVAEEEQKQLTGGIVNSDIGTSRKADSLPSENSSRDIQNTNKNNNKEEEPKASTLQSASVRSSGLQGLKSSPLDRSFAGNVPSSPGKAAASPSPSKLADRLNPTLASLIARGVAQNSAAKSEPSLKTEATKFSENIEDVRASKPKELTHMTRGRAKGPKRKPPTTATRESHGVEPRIMTSSASTAFENEEKTDLVNDSTSTSPRDKGAANSSTFVQSEASTTPQSSLDGFQSPKAAKAGIETVDDDYQISNSTSLQFENPITRSHQDVPTRKAITLSPAPQILPVSETANRMASRSPSPRSKGFQVHTPTSPLATQQQISSSGGLGISPMPSPTSQDAFRHMPRGPRARDSRGSISNIKDLDTQAQNGATRAPDSPSRSTINAIGHIRSRSSSPTKLREWSAPTKKVDHHNTPHPGPGSPRSREAGDSSSNNNIFADYFDVTPVTPAHLLEHIDTQAILTSPNPSISKMDGDKIRTISKQIFEIRGDGKTYALPSQQEHVLYEQEMYVCSHTLASAEGTKSTEAYIWAGAGVSESAIEEVQLFARRVGKENGTKHLIVIRQGKETPNFFQALGGILITLRGTRAEIRQRYMLCGRKHLGHITFDEVDFALGSFCSGFPFLISSDAGKLLLWKGAGCNVEELGCARLISMDLGGGGIGEELSEIDEGHESQSFFDMFASDTTIAGTEQASVVKKMPRSAEYWKLKANHHRYHVRLFRVEQQQHRSCQSPSTDNQNRFQMGSLWPLRRPSWNSASSSPPGTPSSKVGTPPLPRSPGPRPTSSSSSSVPKASIVEMTPFNQSDLEPENVYVLDAFFEIYM